MIEYTLMKSDHVAQIALLEQSCFSMPWSENSIRYELSNPLSLWVVAMEGDCVAGYVGSQSVMGEADMMNLAVAPNYRRKGIGERLVTELVSYLAKRDVSSLTLEVRASNDPAINNQYCHNFAITVRHRQAYHHLPDEVESAFLYQLARLYRIGQSMSSFACFKHLVRCALNTELYRFDGISAENIKDLFIYIIGTS